MKFKAIIHDQLDIFCRDHSIGLLVLFGSSAKGEYTETSDVDLVILNSNTDPLLLNEIFRSGKPLVEREEGVFYRWKAFAWHCYLDTAGLRARQWKHFKQRLAGRA